MSSRCLFGVVCGLLFISCTETHAFQLNAGLIRSLSLRESRHACSAAYQISMAAKGFGSATDKKNQKPVADALAKANNPALSPIPIEKHELPPGSQFMGVYRLLFFIGAV